MGHRDTVSLTHSQILRKFQYVMFMSRNIKALVEHLYEILTLEVRMIELKISARKSKTNKNIYIAL